MKKLRNSKVLKSLFCTRIREVLLNIDLGFYVIIFNLDYNLKHPNNHVWVHLSFQFAFTKTLNYQKTFHTHRVYPAPISESFGVNKNELISDFS